jgi:hypothetical protein
MGDTNLYFDREAKSFLNASEYIDFDINLQWVLLQTYESLEGLHLEESYSLLKDFLKEWQGLLWKRLFSQLLSSKVFLDFVKKQGSQRAYRYKGRVDRQIVLPCGERSKVSSPYFVKSDKKRGKKKKGPNGRGCHLGLELLGFVNAIAPNIVMKSAAFSTLCPSFEFASQLLKQEGVILDSKQLSQLCEKLSTHFFKNRVQSTLQKGESLEGLKVLITTDGGRSRQRQNKRGKKPKGYKRQAYDSNWIEPKMLSITILDDEGNPVKDYYPHVDGEIEVEPFMSLLEDYLRTLKIHLAKEITLCADGAPWIWNRIPTLLKKLGVPTG